MLNYTITSSMVSPNWLVDSATSHYVTGDFKNLTTASPYQGSDSVLVGNGTCLGISHTGFYLYLPFIPNSLCMIFFMSPL